MQRFAAGAPTAQANAEEHASGGEKSQSRF
jgi:hypothetical protein